jgi:hypothetical protein
MYSSPKLLGCTSPCFEYDHLRSLIKILANFQQEVEDDEKTEGFWRELFLLKPDIPQLRQILEDTDAEFLLHLQVQSIHDSYN